MLYRDGRGRRPELPRRRKVYCSLNVSFPIVIAECSRGQSWPKKKKGDASYAEKIATPSTGLRRYCRGFGLCVNGG